MLIDLTMNVDQKIERMATIAECDSFLPEYDKTIKQDALTLIQELKSDAKEISLRTLISVCKIRASNPKDYRALAEYMICA
jgi:hypothetical protein